MKHSTLLRVSSLGLFLISIVFFDYSNTSLQLNYESYSFLLFSIILFILSFFLTAPKNINRINLILSSLIYLLVLFIVLNIYLIIRFSWDIKLIGWIFVSVCFIIAYSLIKKSNIKNIEKDKS